MGLEWNEMDENEAIKRVAQAAASIVDGISRAIPEPVRAEARAWQREQDAAFEAKHARAGQNVERFRANRGDRHWRRR